MASSIKDLILTFQYEDVRALFNNLPRKDSFFEEDYNGNTFLHLIAKNFSSATDRRISEERQAAVVRFLIDVVGLSPEKKNALGEIPYDLIIKHSGKNNLVAFAMLPKATMEAPAASNPSPSSASIVQTSQLTQTSSNSSQPQEEAPEVVSAINIQLFELCRTGNVIALKRMLDEMDPESDINAIRSKSGETLLIAATREGHKGVAMFLITYSRMKIDVLARDLSGKRASDYAEDTSLEELLKSVELARKG